MATQNQVEGTATPTASRIAEWDANVNLSANSMIGGYATTVTAAATTTLTVSSAQLQFMTGSTTQIVKLPVTSTLVLGQSFTVVNNSTGVVTVESSGGNTIQAQAASTTGIYTCILITGTTAASWSVTYINNNSGGSGTVNSGTAGQVGYYATSSTAISGGTLQNVLGIATNTSASTGYVGEFVTSHIANANGVSINSVTATDMTSISLTAGDWDVWGNITFISGTSASNMFAWISTTSASIPESSLRGGINDNSGLLASDTSIRAPDIRLSLSTTTTVYLSGYLAVSAGSFAMAGTLSARRRT